MSSISTKKFKHSVVTTLKNDVTSGDHTYYVMAGRSIVYDDGDDSVPTPIDTTNSVDVDPYEKGIFAKKITASDVMPMAPRYDWATNTVYTMYDDAVDLTGKQYYVVTTDASNYFVYKCLSNAGGARSTVEPSDTVESACNFVTADGYVWKLMYQMSDTEFEKFATTDYIPVVTSANVAGNTVAGAIDIVDVVTRGSNYIATLTGEFIPDDLRQNIPGIVGNSLTYRLSNSASSNTGFYIGSALYITSGAGSGELKKITNYYISSGSKIIEVDTAFASPPESGSEYLIAPYIEVSGDGTTNARGYATVSSNATVNNFISKVNVITRGQNFTYATATISGNTGGVANAAVLNPIIPPIGGHGSDSEQELGAINYGISVTYNTSEGGFITTENDFRTVTVIKDPLFDNVTLGVNEASGTFVGTETIYQLEYFITLTGNASISSSNTTVTGTSTEFNNSLAANDVVVLYDSVNNQRALRRVTAVTNSTSFVVNSVPSFTSSIGRVQKAEINATGIRKGNTLPYITMSNTEPKFEIGKYVIGATTGAWGKVANIAVNEKAYNNWTTFDNRLRVAYTSAHTMTEDTIVYQGGMSLSNAYYHSSNATYIFLTGVKGVINADPTDPLVVLNTGDTVDLGSVKYTPDLVKGSGDVVYIEHLDPISRSNTQSETIRHILSF